MSDERTVDRLQQQADRLKRLYRETFTSPAGREVLRDLLKQCFMFTLLPQDPGPIALHNFGVNILTTMGISTSWNQQGVVDALLRLPSSQPGKQDSKSLLKES